MKAPYDLHIHSCLSPCADDDMTPNNIVGMGTLCGLKLMALTDHNTCRNCPPFLAACERYGIIGICGMELTTAEDIHVICLFPSLEAALSFDRLVAEHRMKLLNKPEIFGNQILCDHEDNPCGIEENLLIYATDLTIEDAVYKAWEYGGVAYPAHIDREANGIEAILGVLPTYMDFSAIELNRAEKESFYRAKYPHTASLPYFICSDAHRLTDIREDNPSTILPDGLTDAEAARIFVERIRQRQTI